MAFDFNFQISPVAWAVARDFQLYHDPDDETIDVFPWYNGRERGLCFVVVHPDRAPMEALCVCFGENRNSDQIFVDSFIRKGYDLNPPTVHEFTDDAYSKRTSFPPGEYHQASLHIKVLINEFHATALRELNGPNPVDEFRVAAPPPVAHALQYCARKRLGITVRDIQDHLSGLGFRVDLPQVNSMLVTFIKEGYVERVPGTSLPVSFRWITECRQRCRKLAIGKSS